MSSLISTSIYLLQFSSSAQECRQWHKPSQARYMGTHDPSRQLSCPPGHAVNSNIAKFTYQQQHHHHH